MVSCTRMHRAPLTLLLLCACVARPADDSGDDDPTSSTMAADGTTDTAPGDVSTNGGPVSLDTTSATLDDSSDSSDSSSTTATSSTTDEPLPVSFDAEIQPIFDEHCVEGCHEPGGQWGVFLDLSPGTAYASIVGVLSPEFPTLNFIEPGIPESSYLWHKVNGTQVEVGGSGVMMPLGMATVVRPEQFAALEEWILQGAPF